MIRGLVREFVSKELIPIEMQVGDDEELDPEILKPLQDKAKALDLWLLDIPQEYGGMGLSLLGQCVVREELCKARMYVGHIFGPHIGPSLLLGCNAEQRERFLLPAIREEIRVCFAQTEP